jgi:type I restriction enzyme S subunit
MSFPRYPEYKDSGVAWLGEVPAHWGVGPLYSLAAERDEPNTGMLEDNLLSLSYGRIIPKDINSNDGLLPESFETYQIVRPGDIVFRLTDLQNDKRSLRTAIVEETGIITSAYVAARPVGIAPRYLSQLLRAYDVTKVFYSMGGGLRQSMKFSDLKRLPTLLPPPDEQAAISAFLDREAAKIDVLVAEQEKLVALLKEKRQAVISHAVTKGLDPTVPMKDSGIEWLGRIPTHWKVVALARIALEKCDGPFGSGIKSDHYTDAGALVVRLQNIRSAGFFRGEPAYLELDYFKTELFRHNVVPGDVLVAGLGDENNLVGRACVAPEGISPALVKADCFRFRLERTIADPVFIATQLSLSAPFDAGQLSTGSTRSRIPLSVMATRKVALPPREEQRAIVTILDHESAKFDSLTAEAENGIALLKERRNALISAAVTGEIDVRGLARQNESASYELAGSPA